jgi:Fe-S-cluster containining protein
MDQLLEILETHSKTLTDAHSASDANPCVSCGACCAHFRVSFYFGELTGYSGGWVPIELTTKVNAYRAAMKGTEVGNGRCVALRGEVGKLGVSCSIYQHRPSTCREFDAWEEDGTPSPECQRLRVRRGLPVLQPRAVSAALDAIAVQKLPTTRGE